MGETGPVHFLNLEYFLRLIYEALLNGGIGDLSALAIFAATIWTVFTVLSFIAAAGFLWLFSYATMRLYQVRQGEAHKYHVEHAEHAEVKRDHSRWAHIMQLIESHNESDWRQAVIEADIMLFDLLGQLHYPGATVGERLKAVDPSRFQALNEAWDAHKVRNEIAHQGSAYRLDDNLAYRTIRKYEAVFKEHGEI